MKRWLLSALILGACAVAGNGALHAPREPTTFYVSADGSDLANGSDAAPFRTLQRAVKYALAGDTVAAGPGNYAGFCLGWDSPQTGAAGAPITIVAQPGAIINARNGKSPDGIDIEAGCAYIVIKGFTIDNTAGDIRRAGIRVCESSHVSIVGNTSRDNGDWGIYASHCNDLLIEGNTTTGSKKQHGIYVCNGAARPVIRGNTCAGNANCGIHINGDLSQGGSGVITDAIIENNIIHDNGRTGGSGINCDGIQHSVIRCNLLYANHSSGISLFRDDASDGSKNNLVVNNTIVMADNARWALNIRNGSTDNVVRNNIFLNANPTHGSTQIDKDCLSGFSSDYNIVETRFAIDENSKSLSEWRDLTGQDRLSKTAVAKDLFVDFDGHDFHLAKNSAAVRTGIVGDVKSKTDLEGKKFGDLPDIGTYSSSEEVAR